MASSSLNSHTQTESDDLSAKNSFLKNPDLVAMTFSQVSLSNYKKREQSLLNLALTCKDFLDEALDALWEELRSLMPLLKVLPALQVEDGEYVLSGNMSQADCDRLQYYSRRVKSIDIDPFDRKVHPSTFIRIAQFQSSALFPSLRRLRCNLNLGESSFSHIFRFLSPLLDSLEVYSYHCIDVTIVGPFLATLSSSPQMLSRIVFRDSQMSGDILKKSIVRFKQLRSLELSTVFMSDLSLLEVLGTLPSLADLTLMAIDPPSHSAHVPENSHSQSGGPKYFDALKSLSVTGSFFFIQHLLDFIDSPYLKSIEVYPDIDDIEGDHGHDNLFTSSMTILASKWSQSLTRMILFIFSPLNGITGTHRYTFSKSLALLTDFHEMQEFTLNAWKMENTDDIMRRLVMSWPKLRLMSLPSPLHDTDSQIIISWSTLRIIAENCPQLRSLRIQLDTTTIPPFDTFSKSLGHKLKSLTIGTQRPTITDPSPECLFEIALHLDFIFPYLEGILMISNDAPLEIGTLVSLCQVIRRCGGQPTVPGIRNMVKQTQACPGPGHLTRTVDGSLSTIRRQRKWSYDIFKFLSSIFTFS